MRDFSKRATLNVTHMWKINNVLQCQIQYESFLRFYYCNIQTKMTHTLVHKIRHIHRVNAIVVKVGDRRVSLN